MGHADSKHAAAGSGNGPKSRKAEFIFLESNYGEIVRGNIRVVCLEAEMHFLLIVLPFMLLLWETAWPSPNEQLRFHIYIFKAPGKLKKKKVK